MTPRWPDDAATRWSRRLVAVMAWLVPGELRDERTMEWEAELWHLRYQSVGRGTLVLFLAGVWWDAVWTWTEGWSVDSMMQDARYAVRTLARSPGFTLAATVTLALSIGASAALFSVVEEALLADPPYPEADRLVVVDMLFALPETEMQPSQWSYPRFEAMRDEVASVESLSGYAARSMTLTDLGDPTVVPVEVASPSLFPLLGATAERGRLFGAEERDQGDARMVALVSEGFWQTRMGGAPDVVGSLLTLDGLTFQVLGVVDGGYRGMSGNTEVWIPFPALREVEEPGALEDPWNQYFYVLGRLAPGASLESARSEAQGFGATVIERFPPPVGAARLIAGADVVPFKEARRNPTVTASMVALFAAVLLVLLIATANLAGLLLARGASRQREAAVRASLGAGRTRLVRQLLTESLTLAVLGGVAGVGLAVIGVDVLGVWLTESLGTEGGRGLSYLDPSALSVDWRVFAFALMLTCGVGIAFGLLPAWQAARTDPAAWLKGGGASIGRSGGGGMLSRSVLMVGQVALAMVLLTAASLMMRTTVNLQQVDLGFDQTRLLTAVYALPAADEAAGLEPGLFHTGLVERLEALPGVSGATVGEVPMGGPTHRTLVLGSEGRPELTPDEHLWIRLQPVAEGHLDVLGTDLLEGRGIEATDDWNTEKVVVLGRMAAAELFPDGQSPLGRKVELSWPGYGGGATVVGVMEDMRLDAPGTPPERLALLSVRQSPRLESGLMIRTAGDPDEMIPAVRSVFAEVAPNVALTSVMSMEDRAFQETVRTRVLTLLLGFFGLVALFLVAVGLYAAIAYAVSMRTRELGLRASLGADGSSLVTLMLRQGLGVTGAGIALGVVGSLAATRMLGGLVYGVGTVDPTGLFGVAVGLLIVGLLAAWIPARRSLRIDPMVALRSD